MARGEETWTAASKAAESGVAGGSEGASLRAGVVVMAEAAREIQGAMAMISYCTCWVQLKDVWTQGSLLAGLTCASRAGRSQDQTSVLARGRFASSNT